MRPLHRQSLPLEKFPHGKILPVNPPPVNYPPPNQKNPPENVCTLPSNHYYM